MKITWHRWNQLGIASLLSSARPALGRGREQAVDHASRQLIALFEELSGR
ncbi:hypothetical protein ACWCXH_39555 [Kitasatospora sp. NPDC001660]